MPAGRRRPRFRPRLVTLLLVISPETRRKLRAGDGELLIALAAEGVMALLLVLINLSFSAPEVRLVVTGLAALLVLIALVDLKYRLVLNVVLLPAAAAVLAGRYILLDGQIGGALLGAAAAMGLFFLAKIVSRGPLGGGDIKLAAFLGLLFGLPDVIWTLLAAVLAGGAAVLFMLLVQRSSLQSRIPYAPFLCFGGLLLLFVQPAAWF